MSSAGLIVAFVVQFDNSEAERRQPGSTVDSPSLRTSRNLFDCENGRCALEVKARMTDPHVVEGMPASRVREPRTVPVIRDLRASDAGASPGEGASAHWVHAHFAATRRWRPACTSEAEQGDA